MNRAPLLLFGALALFPLAARFGPEAYLLSFASRALILALAALSLEFLIGQAGLISFGHAAYIGIGGYAVAVCSLLGIDDLIAQLLFAVLAAALFASLTGFVSLRATGVYYIMSSLAFGQMLYFLFVSQSSLGGDDGFALPDRSQIAGSQAIAGDAPFYYLCLAILAISYVGLARISASRFGRVIDAVRQNDLRARALGFSPLPYQLVACVVAGALASIAGVLLANHSEFVAPSFMSWQRSGELIVMTVLGGIGSLWGAIVGAIAYLVLDEALSVFTEQSHLIMGPFLVVVALFGRRGLAGWMGSRRLM